jgi:hypothetical protein
MKRLLRLLSSLATILSLVLCVATIVLWARSMTAADMLSFSRSTQINGRYAREDFSILSATGFLVLIRARMAPVDDPSADWPRRLDQQTGLAWSAGTVDGFPPRFHDFVSGLGRIGTVSGQDNGGRAIRYWRSLEVPDWLILLVVSLPTQRFLIRKYRAARARRRMPDGKRIQCGYDLRATPERCPECGTTPPANRPTRL